MQFKFQGRQYMSDQGWGEFHPDYNYWFNPECIDIEDNNLILAIDNTPKHGKAFGAGQAASKKYYLYGTFEWEYTLPIGRNIWPAIWLTGAKTWPPEIDVMEGWSSEKGIHKNKRDYRRFFFFNDIQPRLHFDLGNGHKSKAQQVLYMNYTFRKHQIINGKNTCKLDWTPDSIKIYYNNHLVFECKDKTLLEYYNKPMIVVMNNAVTKDFTEKDYHDYNKNGRPLIIHSFKYAAYEKN